MNSLHAKNKLSKEIILSKILWPLSPPPIGFNKFDAPLVHKVFEFYKKIYLLSSKIPKKDRFGIYLKIENICIEIIDLAITASLEQKFEKIKTLKSLRIMIEKLKRFVRIIKELNIITDKKYIELETDLQEISRMTNGWIKYLN